MFRGVTLALTLALSRERERGYIGMRYYIAVAKLLSLSEQSFTSVATDTTSDENGLT